jgi:hypothetical protein
VSGAVWPLKWPLGVKWLIYDFYLFKCYCMERHTDMITFYSPHFGTVWETSTNNVQKQLGLNKMRLDTIWSDTISQKLYNTSLTNLFHGLEYFLRSWQFLSRSQLPRGLRCSSAAACLLRLWVWILPGAHMSVSCECCVLSGRGLCDGLITCPEVH